MSTIINKIFEEYGINYPILTTDFPNATSNNTRQYISRCVKSGQLKRYEKGVYYFPQKTRWGESRLSPVDVCKRKYISFKDQIYGYLAGDSLENIMGFTTQMPNSITICTNNTSSRSRKVCLDGQKFTIKKSRLPITSANYKEIQFLDLLNTLSERTFLENKKKLSSYCKQNKLQKNIIEKSIIAFPARVGKRIVEGGFYNVFT